MNWPTYGEYKESGVNWIDRIPVGWECVSTRYLCDIQTGDKDTVDSRPNGKFPFYVRSQTIERINSWSFDGEAVLTAGDGAGVGKVFHYVTGKFDAHQRVYVFNHFRRVYGRYFHYYFANLFARVALDGGAKSTVDSLRRPVLASFPVVFPSENHQRRIVHFLDRETAKIDALIAKQEQLIATLREDRAATITQAATKGLDPDADMKDSGVEWLGSVPARWIVSRFSRHIAINSGQVDPRVEPYRDTILIAPNHVEAGTGRLVATETASAQGADSGKYQIKVGQIIYSKIRPNLSKVVIAPMDCICSADMYGLAADPDLLDSGYLLYMLLSKPFTDYVVDSSMRVAMPKVNHDSLGAAPVWIPPKSEQVGIVRYVDARCAKIDALIAKSTEMIDTLREYRSALITDAVTGKIDVRGVV